MAYRFGRNHKVKIFFFKLTIIRNLAVNLLSVGCTDNGDAGDDIHDYSTANQTGNVYWQ